MGPSLGYRHGKMYETAEDLSKLRDEIQALMLKEIELQRLHNNLTGVDFVISGARKEIRIKFETEPKEKEN